MADRCKKIKAPRNYAKIGHAFPKMQELVSLKRVADSDSLHFSGGKSCPISQAHIFERPSGKDKNKKTQPLLEVFLQATTLSGGI